MAISCFGSYADSAPRKVMSALPPKADMCGAARDVRFGPIADILVADWPRDHRARAKDLNAVLAALAYERLELPKVSLCTIYSDLSGILAVSGLPDSFHAKLIFRRS